MRRHIPLVFALAICTFVAACGDAPSEPDGGLNPHRDAANAIIPGTCTTVGALNTLARAVFLTASPTVTSVLGKIENLDRQINRGQFDKAREQAHAIVDFALKHYHAGRLPGTDAALTAFVNAIYCFAGIDIRINEPSNSHLILPGDVPQVVYSVDAQAAIKFEANPVSEPTLVEFRQLPDTFTVPGSGPLDTKLDQYPGFLTITKSSETNAPLTKPAVVGICASGVIPQEVRDRLRLGHGASSGFAITQASDASFLDCANEVVEPIVSSGLRRAFDRIADFLQPTPLHARSAMLFRAGGGVGGTVTEFSPFAPVDPELRAGGGVGGTVTEFMRAPMSGLLLSNTVSPVEPCLTIRATEGAPVPQNCRPFVRITTRLGTSFATVPVTWAVTLGGGNVAALTSAECGAYASTALTATDLFGRARICWKLGVAGANRVTATPAVGGDASAGVTFQPATVTFDAVATIADLGLPTVLTIIEGNGQTAPAGQTTPIAPVVKVTDPYGNPVAGVPVTWLQLEGSGSGSPAQVLTNANGLASAVWTLGVGYNKLKAYIDHTVFVFVYFDATGTAAP